MARNGNYIVIVDVDHEQKRNFDHRIRNTSYNVRSSSFINLPRLTGHMKKAYLRGMYWLVM